MLFRIGARLAAVLVVFSLFISVAFAKEKASEQEITLSVPGFQEMLIATGKTSPGHIKQLQKAVAEYFTQPDPMDTSVFKNFLKQQPQSEWRVALQLNLGMVYYQSGAFSDAIAVWEDAWNTGKSAKGLKAKAMVDRAFGELIRMHARLGHADEIQRLLDEAGDRVFIGPATELVTGAKEGLWAMRNNPGVAYLCGPSALASVVNSLNSTSTVVDVLSEARSSEHGFSLNELNDLAISANIDYRKAKRKNLSDIPFPAVIHWKVNHYAAVIGEENGIYHVKDPTFGTDLWIPKKVLEKESSGYFLIQKEKINGQDWLSVPEQEAETIFGMGYTNTNDSNPTCPTCCPVGGGGGGGGGMPEYAVNCMVVSLTIKDTPVSYLPPRSELMDFTLRYSQREGTQLPANPPFFNLGNKWLFNWLSFMEDNPNTAGANVRRAMAAGGAYNYTGYSGGTGLFSAEMTTGAVLERTGDGAYTLHLKDGAIEKYGYQQGISGTFRRVFLTEKINKQGQITTLSYETITEGVRLLSITDSLGQVTELAYENVNPLLITKIIDPFDREAVIEYSSGKLDSITDAETMSSSFAYTGDFVNAMTTPYGATSFAYGGSGTTRWFEATDINGETERLEYSHGEQSTTNNSKIGLCSAPGQYGPSCADPVGPPAETDITMHNQYIDARNTFYWDKRAYKNYYVGKPLVDAYPKAKIHHWLHTPPLWGITGAVLESIKNPNENRIWYNYPGQTHSLVTGTQEQPTYVGQKLDDGSTKRTLYQRDTQGRILCKTDPENNVTKVEYAANGIDLLYVKRRTDNTIGLTRPNCSSGTFETLQAYTYYPNTTYGIDHLVNTHTVTLSTGITNTTTFTYNTEGQVKTVIDNLGHNMEYFYDANGYLEKVRDQANGVDLVQYTYDAIGRVYTKTNTKGFVETYTYDNLNRLKLIDYLDGSVRSFAYDKLDMVTEVDRNGDTIKRSFDDVRNLTAIDYYKGFVNPGDEAFESDYDHYANGKLRYHTDGVGNITANVLDAQSRVLQVQRGDAADFNLAADPVLNDADTNNTTYAYENTTSRLKSITDAKGGLTQYGYDKADRILTVTDDNGVVTTFHYSQYGQLEREDSPDRGSIEYVYDTASRLIDKKYYAYTAPTSALGTPIQSDKFTYDSLNRLTTIDYATDATIDRIYTYDLNDGSHSNSVGRLSRITGYAADGTTLQYQMDYQYDAAGNVEEYRLTQDSVTYITSYLYDNENQLTRITHPDGFGVRCDYTNGRLMGVYTRVNPQSAYQLLVDNFDYLPFGPAQSMEYGNGLMQNAPRDKAYRLTNLDVNDNGAVNVLDRSYGYDIFSNINAVTNNLNANRNWGFDYDAAQRLDDVTGPLLSAGAYGHMQLTYDDVGNRLTKTLTDNTPTTLSNESYSRYADTNRLDTVIDSVLSITRDFNYDGKGNVTSDSKGGITKILNYDAQNRMASVDQSGAIDPLGTYVYSALGQRISKDVSAPYYRKIHYHYDLNGQLIAESNDSGITIKRYVFVQGQLVAVFVPNDDDNDQMADDWELLHFGDLSHDGTADTDSDGTSEIQEYFNSTNPYDADDDGLGDRWELAFTGNLSTVNDPNANPDNDYLTNAQEWLEWRNPLSFDDLLPLNGIYKGIILHKQEVQQ